MKTFYMLNIFNIIILCYLNYYIGTCVGFPRNSNIHLNKRSARLTSDSHSYDRDFEHKNINSYPISTLSKSLSNQSIKRQQDYKYYDSIRGIRSYGKHESKQKNKQKNKKKNKQKNNKNNKKKIKQKNKKYLLNKQMTVDIGTCVGFPSNSNIRFNKWSTRLSSDWHSYDRDIEHKNITNYPLSTYISNQSINRQQDYKYYDSIRGKRSYGKYESKHKNKQNNKHKNKQKNEQNNKKKIKQKNKKYLLNKQLAIDMKHPLNADDFKRAKLLTIEDYIYNQNVFTDDIIKGKTARNANRNQKLWPSGIVEYVISHEYPDEDRAKIAKAFEEYHEKTCIKFIPKNNTSDKKSKYIRIASVDSCGSRIGMIDDYFEEDYPYSQLLDLKIGHKCFRVGTVIHELMHTIGFDHEHNRPDRDDYIKIIWDNIPKKIHIMFMKRHPIVVTTLDEPYDFNSIMHYPLQYQDKDIIAPLEPLPKETVVGQRFGFSKIDLAKIDKLYKNECKNK